MGSGQAYRTFGTPMTRRMVLILKQKVSKRTWFEMGSGIGIEAVPLHLFLFPSSEISGAFSEF